MLERNAWNVVQDRTRLPNLANQDGLTFPKTPWESHIGGLEKERQTPNFQEPFKV